MRFSRKIPDRRELISLESIQIEENIEAPVLIRRVRLRFLPTSLPLLFVFGMTTAVNAQGNYEIQVYGADTVAPRSTMVELHSNFTAEGHRISMAWRPTNHAEHETVEITQGHQRLVGSWLLHLHQRAERAGRAMGRRPHSAARARAGKLALAGGRKPVHRVRLPARALFAGHVDWEIRPIVDKTSGRWYFAVNPALERTWHGPDVKLGIDFSPAVKISYDFTKQITGGVEYYADYGSITNIASLHDQQQQIFPAIDLNVSPKWEINFGVGIGPTAATDHWIVKGIIGRRFDWGHKRSAR